GIMCYCPPFDIEGNPRPYPVGTMPDMGAYESPFPVGVEENESVHPTEYALYQNYPNPFNPTTSISFFSKESGKVNLAVYNVAGEKVASLVDRNLKSGYHKINFDASRLNSGVYYYTLVTPETRITKKMVLVK
ncbi:MAG: T9SS type A sorting domain-containing protein, partial [Candidatus Delongbacteria bacterium]|nr:T9SS type A sorting domain-containing protein [Candidatus Delongbacteria bacterium]